MESISLLPPLCQSKVLHFVSSLCRRGGICLLLDCCWMCWVCSPPNRSMLVSSQLVARREKLVQSNSREAPATQWQGVFFSSSLLLPTWTLRRGVFKAFWQFSLSFNRQNSFTHLCFQLSAREGQPELPQFKLREADGKGQDFLQSCKLLLQTLGQLSQEVAADAPCCLHSNIGLP